MPSSACHLSHWCVLGFMVLKLVNTILQYIIPYLLTQSSYRLQVGLLSIIPSCISESMWSNLGDLLAGTMLSEQHITILLQDCQQNGLNINVLHIHDIVQHIFHKTKGVREIVVIYDNLHNDGMGLNVCLSWENTLKDMLPGSTLHNQNDHHLHKGRISAHTACLLTFQVNTEDVHNSWH